jgi:5-methylcytosine-specific restriction enzyme subunit McrC
VTGRVLELQEEAVRWFPRTELRDLEVLALSKSGRFEIEPASLLNNYSYGIRSRGWVGHIPVGDNLLVRIVPKVPIGNLFGMLEVAYNLPSFRILDGEIEIESIEDLYERIVSILARRVLDRARKGLYRTYTCEEDELTCVRGRIDPVATMLNVFRGIPRVPCSYEQHTSDVEENRILFWTLHTARRQAIRQPRIRRELDFARRTLVGSITLERKRASDCVGRLYNRLNDDYSVLHGLCRFILEQSGPGIEGGDRTFVPFVVNMPRLFEAFVAEWLRRHPPPGIAVRPQHTAVLDADFKLSIHIDIVLIDAGTNEPVIVLDTKYMMGEEPTEADIYQIAFYAREMQVRRGILVYPSPAARQFWLWHGGDTLLESLVFDVSAPLEKAGQAFRDELFARIGESRDSN